MSLPQLADRQREILRAVIHEFITTAQPVASGALVRRYALPVSSATVRNELAELEDLGLLTHPHTSAGRVPTDLGYRYFIESLMPDTALQPEEQLTVSHQFQQAQQDSAQWLRLAASTSTTTASRTSSRSRSSGRTIRRASATWSSCSRTERGLRTCCRRSSARVRSTSRSARRIASSHCSTAASCSAATAGRAVSSA